jgi:hypothetical protein
MIDRFYAGVVLDAPCLRIKCDRETLVPLTARCEGLIAYL